MKTKTAQAPDNPALPFDDEGDEGRASVELVPASEATAIMRQGQGGGETMLMQLAHMEAGLQVVERASQVLATIRRNALRLTGPGDWVAMKEKGAPDEAAHCLLSNSGARRIAPFFGISIEPAQPTDAQGAFEPRVERGDEGEIQLHGWTVAHCALTGETVRVSGSRSSSEKFTGRSVDFGASELVAKSDLARSLETLLHSTSVRTLGGMKKVPIQELADAGIKTDLIPRGSGFGTASDRAASSVASDDVVAEREKLRDEIVRRTGGDKKDCQTLLQEITSGKNFGGFTSIDRLAQDWQVKNAWEKLRKHPTFGDQVQGGGNGGGS